MANRPKPTALKLMEGNRGKRPILPEPEPPKGPPKMPPGLPDRAKTIWKRLAVELDALNLITAVDGAALEGACVAYAHAVMADRAVEKCQREIGVALKGNRPKEEATTWYYRLAMQNAASKKAWSQYKLFCTEFGLTPASRTRLSVGDTGQTINAVAELIG